MTDSKPADSDSKITTIVKKDPKRVEAGKKLEAISKAAKEKKMREKIEMEKNISDNFSVSNNYAIAIGVTLLVILYCISFLKSGKTLKPDKVNTSNLPVKRETVLENL